MNPLKIVLVHRDHPRMMAERMIGMWAYDVPEFEVTVVTVSKYFTLTREIYTDFDAVFWEDSRTVGVIKGEAPVPIVYYVGDSTLSKGHFQHRREMAEQADLILVDWDRLERFEHLGVPVKRLSYCVNERLFYPREKTIDVGLHASLTDERRELHDWLTDFCAKRGYSYEGGRREGAEYYEAIGKTRVNVNLNRNPETRAHRCYDVMASRSCLLTSPMPEVSGEDWQTGIDFITWVDHKMLAYAIDWAMAKKTWEYIAMNAYAQDHTWSARATQLHGLLTEFIEERENVAVY